MALTTQKTRPILTVAKDTALLEWLNDERTQLGEENSIHEAYGGNPAARGCHDRGQRDKMKRPTGLQR